MNARKGLDYRPLDCYMNDDTKILLGKIGAWGYGCLQLIMNKLAIENGYYLPWNKKSQYIFTLDMYEKDDAKIEECVNFCFDNGIFDKEMYDKFGVLTSLEIQQTYKQITQKRVNPWHTPEYVYPQLFAEKQIKVPPEYLAEIQMNNNPRRMDDIPRRKDDIPRQMDDIPQEMDVSLKQSERESDIKEESNEESKVKFKGEKKVNTSPPPQEGVASEPASVSLADFLSQKLNKKISNPLTSIDTNKVNAELLYKAIRESTFLRCADNLDLNWLIANYDSVISGKYKDFYAKKQNPVAIRHRDYDFSNIKFDNIDDFL